MKFTSAATNFLPLLASTATTTTMLMMLTTTSVVNAETITWTDKTTFENDIEYVYGGENYYNESFTAEIIVESDVWMSKGDNDFPFMLSESGINIDTNCEYAPRSNNANCGNLDGTCGRIAMCEWGTCEESVHEFTMTLPTPVNVFGFYYSKISNGNGATIQLETDVGDLEQVINNASGMNDVRFFGIMNTDTQFSTVTLVHDDPCFTTYSIDDLILATLHDRDK